VRFDSVECLASWVLTQDEPPRAVWVTDVNAPGALVPVSAVRFHRDATMGSPMGRGWQASSEATAPVGALDWAALLDEVRVEMQSEPMPQGQH
jgi:hypothetical protein